MGDFIEIKKFGEINLGDPFFDTLKSDYVEFEDWFRRKSEKKALIFEEAGKIIAFLYLKPENDPVTDVVPQLPAANRLKIGTFKIEAHGTKLGERFMKKIFDYVLDQQLEEIYVTVFPKHRGLVRLFHTFGFEKVGEKTTANGTEDVYSRKMNVIQGDPLKDYPYIVDQGSNKFLLAVYPEFHTRLFADSILSTESYSIVQDRSHTNSIHKIYVSWMKDLERLRPGDFLIIYRTSDIPGRAWYRAVATSVCTVLEIKRGRDFESMEEYLHYSERFSVFDRNELIDWWRKKHSSLRVIKMVYNGAFSKRITRQRLTEEVGLDPELRWGFLELTNSQFDQIVEMGEVEHLKK